MNTYHEKKQVLILSLLFFYATVAIGQVVKEINIDQLKYIGKLDKPFWRLSVMTGSWAKSGLGLVEVPDYFCDSSLSFPYIKRPYSKEYIFSDHVILVRTLGGWPRGKGGETDLYHNIRDADVVYRNKDGQLKLRMYLLKNRIQPYVDAGYGKDITLVLDNIPYALTTRPTMHKYGQASPPDNMREWSWFIKEIAEHLVKWYGIDQIKSWKFRLGTEWDNKERFHGSPKEYYVLYKSTAKALMAVLGEDAKFGPFNASSNAMFTNIPSHPIGIDYFKLANYIKKNNLPFEFAAFSDYSIPTFDHPNQKMAAEPASAIYRMTNIFQKVDSIYPTKKEIHEYGVLNNEFNKPTFEPGARSAAINFNVFFSLWEKGLSKISHWNYSHDWFNYQYPGKDAKSYSFIDGRIWSSCILEHMIGSRVYSYNKNCADSTIIKVLLFEKDTTLYLVASALNSDRTVNKDHNISIPLPKHISINQLAGVYFTGITEQDCVYKAIYEDLKDEDNLTDVYNKPVITLAGIKEMAKDYPKSKEMIARNYAEYVKIMKNSLILKKYKDPILSGKDKKTISINIRATSNFVFAFKTK